MELVLLTVKKVKDGVKDTVTLDNEKSALKSASEALGKGT